MAETIASLRTKNLQLSKELDYERKQMIQLNRDKAQELRDLKEVHRREKRQELQAQKNRLETEHAVALAERTQARPATSSTDRQLSHVMELENQNAKLNRKLQLMMTSPSRATTQHDSVSPTPETAALRKALSAAEEEISRLKKSHPKHQQEQGKAAAKSKVHGTEKSSTDMSCLQQNMEDARKSLTARDAELDQLRKLLRQKEAQLLALRRVHSASPAPPDIPGRGTGVSIELQIAQENLASLQRLETKRATQLLVLEKQYSLLLARSQLMRGTVLEMPSKLVVPSGLNTAAIGPSSDLRDDVLAAQVQLAGQSPRPRESVVEDKHPTTREREREQARQLGRQAVELQASYDQIEQAKRQLARLTGQGPASDAEAQIVELTSRVQAQEMLIAKLQDERDTALAPTQTPTVDLAAAAALAAAQEKASRLEARVAALLPAQDIPAVLAQTQAERDSLDHDLQQLMVEVGGLRRQNQQLEDHLTEATGLANRLRAAENKARRLAAMPATPLASSTTLPLVVSATAKDRPTRQQHVEAGDAVGFAALRKQVQDQQRANAALEAHEDELNADIVGLVQQLQHCQQQAAQREGSLEGQLQSLRHQLERAHARQSAGGSGTGAGMLEPQIEELQTRIQALEREGYQNSLAAKQRARELALAQAAQAVLRQQLERAQSSQPPEQQIAALESKVQRLQQHNAELQCLLASHGNASLPVAGRTADVTGDSSLEAELVRLRGELAGATAQAARLRTRLERALLDQPATEQLIDTETERDDLEHRLCECENELMGTRVALENQQTKLKAACLQRDTAQGLATALQTKVDCLEADRADQRKFRTVANEVQDVYRERDEREQKPHQDYGQPQARLALATNSNTGMKTLSEGEYAALQAGHAELKNDLRTAVAARAHLQEQLAATNAHKQALQSEVQRLTTEAANTAQLTVAHEHLKNENDRLRAKLDSLRTAEAAKGIPKVASGERLQDENDRLRTEIQNGQTERRRLQSANTALEQENSELRAELARLKAQLARLLGLRPAEVTATVLEKFPDGHFSEIAELQRQNSGPGQSQKRGSRFRLSIEESTTVEEQRRRSRKIGDFATNEEQEQVLSSDEASFQAHDAAKQWSVLEETAPAVNGVPLSAQFGGGRRKGSVQVELQEPQTASRPSLTLRQAVGARQLSYDSSPSRRTAQIEPETLQTAPYPSKTLASEAWSVPQMLQHATDPERPPRAASRGMGSESDRVDWRLHPQAAITPREDIRRFVVLYDYHPQVMSPRKHQQDGQELKLHEGDVVKVLGELRDDGFYPVELNGTKGLAPAAFLEQIGAADGALQQRSYLLQQLGSSRQNRMEQVTKQKARSGPRTSNSCQSDVYLREACWPAGAAKYMVARYAYNPADFPASSTPVEQQLSFAKGERLFVNIGGSARADGLVKAQNSQGRLGYVPVDFLEQPVWGLDTAGLSDPPTSGRGGSASPVPSPMTTRVVTHELNGAAITAPAPTDMASSSGLEATDWSTNPKTDIVPRPLDTMVLFTRDDVDRAIDPLRSGKGSSRKGKGVFSRFRFGSSRGEEYYSPANEHSVS